MEIYVCNLPYTYPVEKLSSLFEKYGKVDSAKILVDRVTKRPRGIVFVSINSGIQATEAIAALNGVEIEGRRIVVSKAKARQSKNEKQLKVVRKKRIFL